MQLSLAETKALAKHFDAKLNDIVLAVCAGALRRYFARSKTSLAKSMVGAVPASLRVPGDTSQSNQVTMMLGHEIFDPETNKRALVDHAFIVSGGEITKQAHNWLGQRLDATKRTQVMFIDRDHLVNVFIVSNVPLPKRASPRGHEDFDDDIPF